jgi:hypothetical protein
MSLARLCWEMLIGTCAKLLKYKLRLLVLRLRCNVLIARGRGWDYLGDVREAAFDWLGLKDSIVLNLLNISFELGLFYQQAMTSAPPKGRYLRGLAFESLIFSKSQNESINFSKG